CNVCVPLIVITPLVFSCSQDFHVIAPSLMTPVEFVAPIIIPAVLPDAPVVIMRSSDALDIEIVPVCPSPKAHVVDVVAGLMMVDRVPVILPLIMIEPFVVNVMLPLPWAMPLTVIVPVEDVIANVDVLAAVILLFTVIAPAPLLKALLPALLVEDRTPSTVILPPLLVQLISPVETLTLPITLIAPPWVINVILCPPMFWLPLILIIPMPARG